MPEKAYLLSFENGNGKMAENRQGCRNPGLFFMRRPVQMKYATKGARVARAGETGSYVTGTAWKTAGMNL